MRYVKFMIAATLMLFPVLAKAEDCKTHKVFCKMIKLNPKMDKSRAFFLSNLIFTEAKRVGIDPMISIAILMQENAFKSEHTYHTEESIDRFCDDKGCYEQITIKKSVVDMGIAQINIHTAKNYNLDYERLFKFDVEYAIKAHFTILRDKINACSHLGQDAWTCYHSTTDIYRLRYKDMVERYMVK